MAEIRAVDAVLNVETGSPAADTALAFEIESSLEINAETFSARNKATSGFQSIGSDTRSWQVTGSAHVDQNVDAALDAIEDAALNGTLMSNTKFLLGSPVTKTFTGDTRASQYRYTSPAGDFLRVEFTLVGSGALTKT